MVLFVGRHSALAILTGWIEGLEIYVFKLIARQRLKLPNYTTPTVDNYLSSLIVEILLLKAYLKIFGSTKID